MQCGRGGCCGRCQYFRDGKCIYDEDEVDERKNRYGAFRGMSFTHFPGLESPGGSVLDSFHLEE